MAEANGMIAAPVASAPAKAPASGHIQRGLLVAAGISAGAVRGWAQVTLEHNVSGDVVLCGDEEIALEAAFRGGPGILVIAGTGSHIVGRCADYVLREYPNVVSVFIHADRKFCLDRSMERHSMTEKEMQKFIEKTDEYRGNFYRYHTGHEWADARNYDLCLNSGKLGFEKCVEEIKSYIKIRFDQ